MVIYFYMSELIRSLSLILCGCFVYFVGSVAMNDNSISPSLDIVFHCVGSEESLVECSSSTVGECTSGAALTCGGQYTRSK